MSSAKLICAIIASHGTVYDKYKQEWVRLINETGVGSRVKIYFIYNGASTFEVQTHDNYCDIYFEYEKSAVPGITQKTVAFYKYIKSLNLDYDYILRSNLSSFFDLNKFMNVIDALPRENIVFSKIMPDPVIYFPSGCGFMYSKDIVENMIDAFDSHPHLLNANEPDDILFAKLLKLMNANVVGYNFLNLCGLSEEDRVKKRNICHYHYRTKYQEDGTKLIGVNDFSHLVNKSISYIKQNNVIALVCNMDYIEQLLKTLSQLRDNGSWFYDILLIHDSTISCDIIQFLKTESLLTHSELVENPVNVQTILHDSEKHNVPKSKLFQYAKFHIFNTFMKKWDKVLYIDAGMTISGDVNRFFDIPCENTLFAHSDAYPTYERKLSNQFKLYDKMKDYNLDSNYFQSGLLYYNTNIIDETTLSELSELANKHFDANNDQAIMNLLFSCKRNIWKQLPIVDNEGYLYDSVQRIPVNYVIYKWGYSQ
jgi:hypothetical protein